MAMEIQKGRHDSPLGPLLLAWTGDRLVSLDYADYAARFERLLQRRFPVPIQAGEPPAVVREALGGYFAGDLRAVDALAVEIGGSEFETRVWGALRRIDPGSTVTYGIVAASLGLPKAARAVGRANSVNPIAIVVPCHRVIGANAALTGYAGGLERKLWLLEHERRFVP